MPQEPEKLFGDRLRTSTFVLLVLFAGILVLYVLVRPAPARSTNPGSSTPAVQPSATPSVSPTPSHRPVPARTSLSPTPSSSEPSGTMPAPTPTSTRVRSSLLPLPTRS